MIAFSFQCYMLLPLLPTIYPLLWTFTGFYGSARLLTLFKFSTKVCFLSFLLILGWRLWALSWNNFFILLIIIFNPFDKICSTGEKLCFPQPQISKNHLKRPIKISVNLLHPVICFLPLLRRRPMKICQSHLRKID